MSSRLKPLFFPHLLAERHLSSIAHASSFSNSNSPVADVDDDDNYDDNDDNDDDDSFDSFEFDSYPALSQSVPTSFCKQQLPLFLSEPDMAAVFYTHNSSASDISAPATPSFPVVVPVRSSAHMRNSGSTSSLDLSALPLPLPMATELVQIQQVPSGPSHAKSASKRQLPDVMEEPFEREECIRDSFASSTCDIFDPYCHELCIHPSASNDSMSIMPGYDIDIDIDYDAAIMSDSEYAASHKVADSAESTISHLTSRIGSRFPSITRWRSGRSRRRPTLTSTPSAELTFDTYPAAASSRSSSLSTPSHPRLHQAHLDPPMPASPAMSFCDQADCMAASIDMDCEFARKSLGRDRSQALTPLLPPLMMEALSKPPPHSPHMQSPLQSPLTAPSVDEQLMNSMKHVSMAPSHKSGNSLSTKPSISSFRPSPTTEMPLLFPNIMQEQEHDEWSDSLGHANFTISPAPYQPEEASTETLHKLRDDWAAARVDYTKHIVRTGENYGQTSNIYQLTEKKWQAIEGEWRKNHQELMGRIAAMTGSTVGGVPMSVSSPSQSHVARLSMSLSRSRSRGRTRSRSRAESLRPAYFPPPPTSHPTEDLLSANQWRELEEAIPKAIPRLLDTSGKFPSRGDEDIVGPMVRDAVMIRSPSEERKLNNHHPKFWRSLIGKMKK